MESFHPYLKLIDMDLVMWPTSPKSSRWHLHFYMKDSSPLNVALDDELIYLFSSTCDTFHIFHETRSPIANIPIMTANKDKNKTYLDPS